MKHYSDNSIGAIPNDTSETDQRLASPVESSSSDLQIKSIIKTEKLDETISSDKSFLMPLFEESKSEEVNIPDDFSLVKCKQEPDLHLEEVTASPFSMDDQSVQPKGEMRKRKQYTTHNAEYSTETDSAPECKQNKKSKAIVRPKRKLIAKSKGKKCENVPNRKRSKRRSQSPIVPVIPVKISKANKFMNGWPSLSVNLVDIVRSNNQTI